MAAATVQPAPTGAAAIRWLELAAAIAAGLAIFFIPTPAGLSRTAQTALAITAFTVAL